MTVISKVYKENIKLWIYLFTVLSFIFAHYTVTFFWGNHDWDWIKGTTQVLSFNTGMFEGRFAKFILNTVLFGGQVLPILNNITAFALLALGSVLLVEYWQIKDTKIKIIIALLLILSPFILGWLYFPINILGNFAAIALVAGGLCLSEKKAIGKVGAIICWLIALGVYPSVMEMIIICFCFRCILNSIEFKEIIKNAIPIFLSLILFKLLLWSFGQLKWIVADYYNLKTVTFAELFNRTPQMIKIAFNQLVVSLPFIGLKFKTLGVITVILALISSIRSYKTALLWALAFITTVLSTWLTGTPEETAYMPRINFYGLNFFYLGAMAVLFKKKGKTRNLGYILSIALLYQSVIADFYAQKVWSLGKRAEENLIERISTRIEPQINNKLVPVVAGEISLRPRYYMEKYQMNSPYILNTSFMVRHIPSGMFNFYAAKPLFYGISQISTLSPKLHHFLHTANKSWPAQEAIYVDNDYTVILLTKEGIKAIQAQLPY